LHGYKLDEVEQELTAAVEQPCVRFLRIARRLPMGTAVSTPELRAVVERVRGEFGVGISRFFDESYHTMFDTPIAQRNGVSRAPRQSRARPGQPGGSHVARTPEMRCSWT